MVVVKEPWEIVSYRLRQWEAFTPAPLCTVHGCRARNVLYEAHRPDIRRTEALGDCCVSCWIDADVCEVCGVGVAEPGLVYQGRRTCGDCLRTPEIPTDAWHDWLLYYVYTPRSAFVQIMEDAFAEDFRRTTLPSRRIREWPLTTAHE
jgi:hypothetical protein